MAAEEWEDFRMERERAANLILPTVLQNWNAQCCKDTRLKHCGISYQFSNSSASLCALPLKLQETKLLNYAKTETTKLWQEIGKPLFFKKIKNHKQYLGRVK